MQMQYRPEAYTNGNGLLGRRSLQRENTAARPDNAERGMEGDNLNVKYVYYAGRAGAMNGLSHWNDRFGLVAIAKEEKLKKKKIE